MGAVSADPLAVMTPGGAALNTIRTAAWSAGACVRTAFVGSVGADKHAALLRRAMAAAGVEPLLMVAPGLATAQCAVLVDAETKDRFLAVVRGAAGAITPPFLRDDPAVRAALASAAVLYVTAFVLSTPDRAACAAHMAEVADAHGSVFAMNLSSPGLLAKVVAPLSALLPRSRFVFGNADELRALARLRGWGVGESEGGATGDRSGAQELVALSELLATQLAPGGVAVVTDGAGMTTIAQQRCPQQGCDHAQIPALSVDAASVVDTNGCGDAFVGGFLGHFVQGSSLRQCVLEGHRCAAFVLRRRGCNLAPD